jgi:murein DD-endopeptidase MepM/ murein hydrolase activator NlpD
VIPLLTAAALAFGGVLAGSSTAGADTIDDLRDAVIAARQAADAATARYAEAENHLGVLETEIAALEQQIETDKTQIGTLRAIAQRRAVAAYTRRGVDLPFQLDGDPLDRVRREKMLQEANARDDDAVARLGTLTAELTLQQETLRDRRNETREARDRFQADAEVVQEQLVVAQRALSAFEEQLRREEAARQERERAALAAPRASTTRDYVGAYVANSLICPIRGPVSFVDSWGAPRATTGSHQGVDLMSPRGTPDVAVVSGNVEMHGGSVSGLGVWLRGDDGNLYYYFHLDAYEGGPRHVSQGDVVGYVGNTGDASGGATHTHFEIHPGGGPAVNPYPSVARVC